MRRSRSILVLALVVVACGGNHSGDTVSDGTTTFRMGDVVVTLEVPDGGVPAGTEIKISEGDVRADLAEIDDLTVYAFDLLPSGLTFSEPATITFRLPAPGDTGTPLAQVILEDSEGTATVLST